MDELRAFIVTEMTRVYPTAIEDQTAWHREGRRSAFAQVLQQIDRFLEREAA